MKKAKFVLSKNVLLNQIKILRDKGFEKISYSYKTNHVVGNILQDLDKELLYSVHSFDEVKNISDKSKIQFFCQAETQKEIGELLEKGISFFVVDNEIDFKNLMNTVKKRGNKKNGHHPFCG